MTTDVKARLSLRLSKGLDNKLNVLSKNLGISKNAYILILIAKALAMDEGKKEAAS